MKRKTTDIQIIEYAKEVFSMTALLRKVGLIPAGGNFAHMKKRLQKLKVDTSHWKGQGWSKGNQLKDWSNYTRAYSSKKHIIKIRGYKCEWCSLSEWRNTKLALEIDHVDGDRTNNSYDNLRLLCPNCHSQTKTWRRQKLV